jgi:hypothetical protein
MRHIFDELFASVGEALDNHVKLERADTLARREWRGGARLELFADPARSEAAIADFAGGAAATRFRAFDARARMLFDAFDAPVIRAPAPGPLGVVAALAGHAVALTRAMAPLTSLWGMLGRSFHDPRLRQPFRRHATYVGGSPMRSPALLMLVWRSDAAGVWTVAGGMAARRGPPLQRPRHADHGRGRARVRRGAGGWHAHRRRRGDLQRRSVSARRGAFGAGGDARGQGGRAEAPLAVGVRSGVFGRSDGLCADPPHRVLRRRHLRAPPPAARSGRLCLRPGPPRARRAATARPRAVRNHHERARRGRPHPLSKEDIDRCQLATFNRLEAAGLRL